MKTIGTILKEARLKKRYSLVKVENATRIKKEFIEAVEDENWKILPEFPVVVGFVKNMAQFLGLSERSMVALLRRDYPPKKLFINPKPDVGQRFTWSPKLTFITGISLVILVVVTYLGIQYAKFLAPPSLEVDEPKDGQIISKRTVTVSGKTDGDATVKVNNQPIVTDDSGKFNIQIQIYEGTTEITVKATSRSGKETIVKRMIKPEL